MIKNLVKSIQVRSYVLQGLFVFLWKNKMWWMIPMILLLVVFFLLIIFAEASPLGPFIYTII